MKKIKLIVASLFSLALVLSCNDDGGDSNRNLTTGAVPDIQKTEGSEAFINLSSLQEGNDIAISLDLAIAQGQSEVSSVSVVGFYIKADGTAEKGVLASGLTTFPTTVSITREVLFNNFTSLNSADDFTIGDQLKIICRI